jgi:hypothetical protein
MEDGGMSALPVPIIDPTRQHAIRRGCEILRAESKAIATLAQSLDDAFAEAVEVLRSCRGSVVVTGMGKAGLIGQKISASFSCILPRQYMATWAKFAAKMSSYCSPTAVRLMK